MFDERPASGVKLTSSECAEKASSGEPAERYRTWLACIESQRPRRVALPLGEFKADVPPVLSSVWFRVRPSERVGR